MRRFLSKLAAACGNSTGGQGSRRPNRCFRPDLEALEEREVLSTLFLTPGCHHDAAHVSSSHQGACGAAAAAAPGLGGVMGYRVNHNETLVCDTSRKRKRK
jgi:hypothetical protein